MAGVGCIGIQHTEDWKTLPWKKLERNVFRLQQRIYRATKQGDFRRVRNLQRLLLRAFSARCLSVRRVTQDNRGKRTAGVDGVRNLTPQGRIRYVGFLRNRKHTAAPVRRIYTPKPNGEQRPLGIPTMLDRAYQALVKTVLEPEWEARFESKSYGFRPGRSAHDAVQMIFECIRQLPKYVLDADIEQCFDKINHEALLAKLDTLSSVKSLVRQWLKAGILDDGEWLLPEAGTPQGGVLSPLLANIALHGFQDAVANHVPNKQKKAHVIRYADDFVILHTDLDTILELREFADGWLQQMGLRLKPSKTRITHTLNEYEGECGFDFLGFHIRQHSVGCHQSKRSWQGQNYITQTRPSDRSVRRHQDKTAAEIEESIPRSQGQLINRLNPQVVGWANYFRIGASKATFATMDRELRRQLSRWAAKRHSSKTYGWRRNRYWRDVDGCSRFTDGEHTLRLYAHVKIRRHYIVKGDKSPYDGDWLYWGTRLGRDPSRPDFLTALLKKQAGKCGYCGLGFKAEDLLEIHHKNGCQHDNAQRNLMLLHGHCHDLKHAEIARLVGANDKDHDIEEPDDGKLSRPVLNRQEGGRLPS